MPQWSELGPGVRPSWVDSDPVTFSCVCVCVCVCVCERERERERERETQSNLELVSFHSM